ncbi:unnamed protein product [Notodromas monacha]|uniref:Major facilitator superfamily (MFS) profile domain-containing protein n=1 Tax=Notodromas monacha TaxID=399045 RepID=A0A7R9BTH7_9CRUS|nr:unnamed protein product [Notodromas monacha]CAG0920405.1 unnamed protein product [Notodromas monacha]
MDEKEKRKHLYQHEGFCHQVLGASVGSIYGTIVGTALGFSSVGLPLFGWDENAPFIMGEYEKSVFTSVFVLVMIAGSIVGRYLTSLVGPRMILTALLLPTIASWLLIAFGKNIYLFFISRTILGMCGGIALPIGQMYLTEITSPDTRGFIASTAMLSQYIYGFVDSVAVLVMSWRGLAMLNAVVMAAHFLVSFFLPESPVWLLRKNMTEKARDSLQFVRGKEDVEFELRDLQLRIEESRRSSSGLLDLLKGNYLKPLFVLTAFIAFRQLSGAFAVLSYTVEIFDTAGSGVGAIVSTVIINAVQLCFNFLSNVMTDRIGRKKLYVASASLMGISHFSFGTYYHFHDKNEIATRKFNWVPLVSLIFYCIGFSVGFAPALYVLMTELIPMRIRNSASAVMSVINNAVCFIVVQYFYSMRRELTEAGVFWFYGSICIFAAVFCEIMLPETKGKNLDELEAAFAIKIAPKNESEGNSILLETNGAYNTGIVGVENASDFALFNDDDSDELPSGEDVFEVMDDARSRSDILDKDHGEGTSR